MPRARLQVDDYPSGLRGYRFLESITERAQLVIRNLVNSHLQIELANGEQVRGVMKIARSHHIDIFVQRGDDFTKLREYGCLQVCHTPRITRGYIFRM